MGPVDYFVPERKEDYNEETDRILEEIFRGEAGTTLEGISQVTLPSVSDGISEHTIGVMPQTRQDTSSSRETSISQPGASGHAEDFQA